MSTLSFLWLTVVLLFFLLLASASTLKHRREEIVSRHGVVATDDGRCSQIAVDALKDGGHAVDAAIAAGLCLGVVSPASSGIGGGAFMVVRLNNGTVQAFDMRETAPMKASQDMYGGNETLKKIGILSVAVPGQLAGLHKAWQLHGKLPWERLVQPAIAFAHNGFKISPYVRYEMERTESGILTDKGLHEIFAPNGTLLEVGDVCRNERLADTLKLISKYGTKTFYNGAVGINLVSDIQEAGGILTMEDLQRYEVKMREPIIAKVLGLKLIGMPPPSSGAATMILMLNILAEYDGYWGLNHSLSGPLGSHRKIEALKHAFAVRMNLGDPEFVDVTTVLSNMLSPKLARILKKNINDSRTYGPWHYGGRLNPEKYPLRDHGTSHVSIIDQERNAVSMTNTVNSFFGSQILSPSTGIVLNNEMDDFSVPTNSRKGLLPPAPANFIRPSKRPLSSMSPTIVVKDGKLKAVLGASGGFNIIAGTTQVFLNHFVHKMEPLASVLAPRFYHTWIPNIAYCENWTSVIHDHYEMPSQTLKSLHSKGHVLEKFTSGVICQFVVIREKSVEESVKENGVRELMESIEEIRDYGELVGVSDPRKGGYPAGF